MSWQVRRVVTGRNAAGRSAVIRDSAIPGSVSVEGIERALLWSLPAGSPHASAWRVSHLAPGALPSPALQPSDSLDWITVLDGEIELWLDDAKVRLGRGDCVVQRGARHAWRGLGARPSVLGALSFRPLETGDPRSEGGGPRPSRAPQGVGPRRVVTHSGVDGRSGIAQDGEPPNCLRLEHGAGMAYSDVWQTFGPVVSPTAGGDAPAGAFEFYALGGGACWKHMVIPPDAELARVDAAALAGEYALRAPGMAAGGQHDPERPGRHRTDSIDLLQVLSGRITLVLDDGEVELRAGDFAVQQGTWHAWSNRGAEACVLQAMMVSTQPLTE